jgi:hypothetical protein
MAGAVASAAHLHQLYRRMRRIQEVAANFSTVSDSVKLICAFACIFGRLEVLTIFVLLTPGYWRS